MGTPMNYQQLIRDLILQAVQREIPIHAAAYEIEQIIRKEIDGDTCG
jgi:hypothetical protein